MIGAFQFNGVDAESFQLVCRSIKRPLLPQAKVKRIELAGASGSYDFDGLEYQLRQVTMHIAYIGTNFNELRSRARLIAAWLGAGSWSRLIVNDEPDKYYLAKITDEVDLQGLWGSGEADVSFDCQPFAFAVKEESIKFRGPGVFTFTNPGTRAIDCKSPYGSKFNISVTGSWTPLTLSMNGNSITYDRDGYGDLVFDNVNMEVSLGGVSQFKRLTGDIDTFLKVAPGENVLTVTGANTTAKIMVDYIPMWL